jgi:hypothetical protein
MSRKVKFLLIGMLLGLLVSVFVWEAESTTGEISWPLVASFPISWGIGGYLFARWNAYEQ